MAPGAVGLLALMPPSPGGVTAALGTPAAKQGERPWQSKGEMLGLFLSPCAASDSWNWFELVLHRMPSLSELFLSGLSAQSKNRRGKEGIELGCLTHGAH